MANAYRDSNNIPTLIAASKNDGTTIARVYASPTTHGLVVDDNTTGSDHGTVSAVRDQNNVPVLLAVSELDGVTPVEVYADPATGALLVDSA